MALGGGGPGAGQVCGAWDPSHGALGPEGTVAQRLPLRGGLWREQGMGLGVLLVPVLLGRKAVLLAFAGVFPRYMVLTPVTANSVGLEEGATLSDGTWEGCCRGKCSFLAFLAACLGSAA